MAAKRHFAHNPRGASWGRARPHFGQTAVAGKSGIKVWYPLLLRSKSAQTFRGFSGPMPPEVNRSTRPAGDGVPVPLPPACPRCSPTSSNNTRETSAHPMNSRGDGRHRHSQLARRRLVGDRAFVLEQESFQDLEPLFFCLRRQAVEHHAHHRLGPAPFKERFRRRIVQGSSR